MPGIRSPQHEGSLLDDPTKLQGGDLIRAAMREGTATLVAEEHALQRRERERARRRTAQQQRQHQQHEGSLLVQCLIW